MVFEVADTWAGFALGAVDWPALCRVHARRVRAASSPERAIAALEAWLAALGDSHTRVRRLRPRLGLPYGACVVDGAVVLTRVPRWTDGYAAGLREGFRFVGLDVRGAWTRTAASERVRPLLVARRLLAGDAGDERHLEARGPGGEWIRWTEPIRPPDGSLASHSLLDSGTPYLWIGAWLPGLGVEETIDEALERFAGHDRLIVDLRGNDGGRLATALAFRDRFLDAPRRVAWSRTTAPGGRLEEPEALDASPSNRPWRGRVRFLTDPLTRSASENLLLGLEDLPHVQVVGEQTCGSLGITRSVRLLPGWRLTITQSLMYDMKKSCRERSGVRPHLEVIPDRREPRAGDPVLDAADRW